MRHEGSLLLHFDSLRRLDSEPHAVRPAERGRCLVGHVGLNNDERGNTIHYVGTAVYDENLDGSSFIDKPWVAVANWDDHDYVKVDRKDREAWFQVLAVRRRHYQLPHGACSWKYIGDPE